MSAFDKIKEKASDAGITKAGDAADQKTGGGHTEKIDKVEQTVDTKIGE